jgi:hypothetical protein
MVWESVEAELLDLAIDPITGNYLPRVVRYINVKRRRKEGYLKI